MENNKNSIVLTVIAVATLLVAVVGATFAYLQAQGGVTKNTSVKVQTGTTGSTTFSIAGTIAINANQSNFASGKGDQSSSTTGTASFTAPSQVGTTLDAADLKSCYTVTVKINSNNFVYTNGSTPELVLDVTKGSTKVISSMDITTRTSNVQVPTAANGTTYVHTLQTTAGKTITDSWSVQVTFKNLTTDQNSNAGKTFDGTLEFAKTTCS